MNLSHDKYPKNVARVQTKTTYKQFKEEMRRYEELRWLIEELRVLTYFNKHKTARFSLYAISIWNRKQKAKIHGEIFHKCSYLNLNKNFPLRRDFRKKKYRTNISLLFSFLISSLSFLLLHSSLVFFTRYLNSIVERSLLVLGFARTTLS